MLVTPPQVAEVDTKEPQQIRFKCFGLLGIFLPREDAEQTPQFPEFLNPPAAATLSNSWLRSRTR